MTESIVYWGIWMGTLVTAALVFVWLRRRSWRISMAGYTALVLALVSFVPPFSYVPNPLGIYIARGGGYSYDPRLPFVNRFVFAIDPTAALSPHLDALIGQTGLDPLDPVQPLARYEFTQVHYPGLYGVIEVKMQLTYADGSMRTFSVPLYQSDRPLGLYQTNWRYDGLGRLRTEHRELAGTPFATDTSPVRLGTPHPPAIDLPSYPFNGDNPSYWGPVGYASQHLVWSPQQDAFLATRAVDSGPNELWVLKLDGSPAVRIARNVRDYAWSPDGRTIVFTTLDFPQHLVLTSRDGKEARVILSDSNQAMPGLTDEGIWYALQRALWIAPYDGGEPHRLAALPDIGIAGPEWIVNDAVVRPSPDAQRVAYACERMLCLQDRDGSNAIRTKVPVRELAWNSTGTLLAAVRWELAGEGLVLILVQRDGMVLRQVPLAPSGSAAPPQWTPDGKRLFVQTFPFSGRRILTVDAETGEALDLSQPRWDAWFALSPDGKQVLLTNGRGGFWTSGILYSRESAMSD